MKRILLALVCVLLVASASLAQAPWGSARYVKSFTLPASVTNDPKAAANMGALVGADSLGWVVTGYGYGTCNKIIMDIVKAAVADSSQVILKLGGSEVARYRQAGRPQYGESVVIWGPWFDTISIVRATPGTQPGKITLIFTQ